MIGARISAIDPSKQLSKSMESPIRSLWPTICKQMVKRRFPTGKWRRSWKRRSTRLARIGLNDSTTPYGHIERRTKPRSEYHLIVWSMGSHATYQSKSNIKHGGLSSNTTWTSIKSVMKGSCSYRNQKRLGMMLMRMPVLTRTKLRYFITKWFPAKNSMSIKKCFYTIPVSGYF